MKRIYIGGFRVQNLGGADEGKIENPNIISKFKTLKDKRKLGFSRIPDFFTKICKVKMDANGSDSWSFTWRNLVFMRTSTRGWFKLLMLFLETLYKTGKGERRDYETRWVESPLDFAVA